MSSPLWKEMSDKHEQFLSDTFGGRITPGSGNQSANQMDVRQSRHHQEMAFAFEGKSTLGQSIRVTREMINKAIEQAHGERPAIALRFYDNERLTEYQDWIVIKSDDLEELMDNGR